MIDTAALAGCLFRAHVADGADQVAGEREAGFGADLGKAEVGNP